jgi:hypothetical protein
VLLVAIDRARALVYVIEDGQPVYYLRFGHQTLPMGQTHVTDLLLGRRARPDLRVTNLEVVDVQWIVRPASVLRGLVFPCR